MNLTQVVNNALKAFRRDVPEYLAAGIVDMSTGMLLDADTVDDHPRDILDMLAAATADMFQGRTVTQIEHMWREQRGTVGEDDGGHYFQEILIYSNNLVHLFLRSPANAEIVAAIVCRRNVNIGMLFAQARQGMRELEDAR
jgi:predicted regulator of Ras-like GTPase activity (Roadblock/LC7/MglB family)